MDAHRSGSSPASGVSMAAEAVLDMLLPPSCVGSLQEQDLFGFTLVLHFDDAPVGICCQSSSWTSFTEHKGLEKRISPL